MGYAKCGSTLLQERIFPRLKGVDLRLTHTGNFFEGLGTEPLRARVVSQMFTCSPQTWRIDELAHAVFPSGSSQDLVISEEALYTGFPSNVHVAAHIAAMAEAADRLGYDSFKVLAIHRRQDERLASTYAQNSRHRDEPGQDDFESFCRRSIDPRRDLYRRSAQFHYAELAELLVARLGREHVAYVPIELLDTDPDRFATDVETVVGQAIDRAALTDHSVNVKRSGARSWQISPRTYEMPTPLSQRLLNRLRRSRRPTRFTLSETLAAEVRAAFGPGNRRLAEMFGYPLGELGYY
jgi:hypothetical protein